MSDDRTASTASMDDAHTAPIEIVRRVIRSHADVVAVAHDPHTFSSAVSRYLQIPNGLDGAEHAAWRRLLDPFFDAAAVDRLEPALREIAQHLTDELTDAGTFDAVADLGARFAVRAQSTWLGWPSALEDELLQWVEDNRSAARSGNPGLNADVARRFDAIIRSLLDERRGRETDDVTTQLMQTRTASGRPLDDAEIVSILRNWTGGDLSSLALCTGVVVHWLATHTTEQRRLAEASAAELDAAIDEMLRIDDPFVSNRRIAVVDTEVGGCPVHAGEVLVLDWRDANRDPAVFGDPDAFAPERNAAANLVYGTGPHVCPGRPLATRELRVVVQALLSAGEIVLDAAVPVQREQPPAAGFRTVPVRVIRP